MNSKRDSLEIATGSKRDREMEVRVITIVRIAKETQNEDTEGIHIIHTSFRYSSRIE